MTQPSSKIAEALCGGDERRAGDARLRGDSISSKNSLDRSTCPDTSSGAHLQHCVTDQKDPRFRWLPEAVTLVPPDQPPGLAGVDINPGAVRGEDATAAPIAFEPPSGTRRLVISALLRREDAYARFGKYSAALNVCVGVAMVALTALYSFDDPRQFREFTTKMLSSPQAFIGEQPRLLVEAQKGEANEPLPLGVTVEHASDGAIVTIEGLPDGVDLSFGNRCDIRGWTIAATDLEWTFVGPPAGFVGVIETTATLRAASGRLLDRQALRFEWRANKGEPPDPIDTMIKETVPAGTAAVTPSAQSSSPKSVVALPPLAPPPAVTAKAIECQSSPPPYNKTHWAWRLVDNKKCWYAGEPGMDKSKLHWAANADQALEPAQRTAPDPATRIATPPSGLKHGRRAPKEVPVVPTR